MTTRREFQESYVRHSVLKHIESDFDDAGVKPGRILDEHSVAGERRTLVAQYYAGVDWTSPSDVRPVLDAYELHLLRLQEEGNTTERDRLATYLKRDGLHYVDGRIEFEVREPHLDELVDAELGLDVSQLRVNISRMRGAVEDDPELAIGSSKELVEATCKAVLVDAGVDPPENADIPELVLRCGNPA